MKELLEKIKIIVNQNKNITLDYDADEISLKFYMKGNLYKELKISKEKNHIKVFILEDKITKIVDMEQLIDLITILDKQCNVKEYTQEEVKQIKDKYVEGTKLELIKMYDYINTIPPGTKGFIHKVDDIGTIHVIWENGSSAGLVVGTDEFKIICPLCNQELQEGVKIE